MSTELEPKDHSKYLEALRLAAQGQYPQAAAIVRPHADDGDDIAVALTAQYLLNAGDIDEGKPYAFKAARAGNGLIAQNYFSNLWGQSQHRSDAVEFLKLALDAGYPGDPIAHAPLAAQEGDEDAAIQMLRLGVTPQPPGARAAWEELLATVEQDEARVRDAAEGVEVQRVQALAKIQACETEIGQERERVRRIVEETDQLVHDASAATLAREYGKHAHAEEVRAQRYTWAAIAGGLFAAIGTSAIAYLAFTKESGVGAVLTKGALTIPLILFAGYLARLAGQFRRKAWAWRHVELQIRTSEPFIALLDDEQRKALLAALALRFFPGQSQTPDGEAAADLGDPAAILNSLGFSPEQASKKESGAPPEQPAAA